MMSLWRKACERHITAADALSWLTIVGQRRFSALWGTFRLRVKARLFGVHLEPGVTCCGPVIVGRWPGSYIHLGKNTSLVSCSRRSTAATLNTPVRFRTFSATARIELDEGVELSGTSLTARSCTIRIGAYTMFGPNGIVVDSDFHALWPAETRHIQPAMERDAPVTIGKHVWIGMNCIILKGVTIGDGAVVAAGSVVTRDIPAMCVAAGVPARVVKHHETQKNTD